MPNAELHDVLVYPPDGSLTQLEIERTGDKRGSYTTPPKAIAPSEPGRRKVDALARLDPGGAAHGPAFTTLPNKPDPQASQMSCYLIDPKNFRSVTPWTFTEWNQGEDGKDEGLQLHGEADTSDDFELLIAVPLGKVFFVWRTGGNAPQGREVDMRYEGELWTQLRNGVVAGSVRFVGHPTKPCSVVPLVNVTSLKTSSNGGAR